MDVLVTDFRGHWDRLRGRTSYPHGYVFGSLEGVSEIESALLIRVEDRESLTIRSGWEGVIHDITDDGRKVWFSVSILRELSSPEVENLKGLRIGWHRNYRGLDADEGGLDCLPAFYSTLAKTRNYEEFEFLVYRFIRALGIHDAYRFPSSNQAGRADGFFRFGTLAVMYDATLQRNYAEAKQTQIRNYSAQLQDGHIDIKPGHEEHIAGVDAQVWIVTRGHTQLKERIGGKTTVKVKEIAIERLKQVYQDSMRNEWSSDRFCDDLKALGE